MQCLEQDMEDMYWEVPKDEMLQSLTWALALLSKGKTELFFSLAKGGLNELDRVGTASSDHFVVHSCDFHFSILKKDGGATSHGGGVAPCSAFLDRTPTSHCRKVASLRRKARPIRASRACETTPRLLALSTRLQVWGFACTPVSFIFNKFTQLLHGVNCLFWLHQCCVV